MPSKKLRKNNTDFNIRYGGFDDNFAVLSVFTGFNLFEFLLLIKQNFNIEFKFLKNTELIYNKRMFIWPVFYHHNENLKSTIYIIPNQSNPDIIKNNANDLFNQTSEQISTGFIYKERENISYFIILKDGEFRHVKMLFSDKLSTLPNTSVHIFSRALNWEEILLV